MPTLSVIVPVYGVERYIEECIESIVYVDDIEIILVNDCTPDSSMELVAKYINNFDNIKVINNQTNKGLGETRNIGIQNATGKYIFFLDSDDYVNTIELRKLVALLKIIDYDQVLISFSRFNNSREVYPPEFNHFFRKNHNKILGIKNFKELINIINLSQLRIMKREKILTENIKFPHGIYEDILWSYWLTYVSKEILVLNNRMYLYRYREGSILSSTSKRHFELLDKYKKTIDFFISKGADEKHITILQMKFITHSKFLLFHTERIPQKSKEKFYQEAILNLGKFKYSLAKNIFGKDVFKKNIFFIKKGYFLNSLYRDSKFIFSKKGFIKLRSLVIWYFLKLFPSRKNIWVFGSRFGLFTDNTKYFYLLNREFAEKDNIDFIWISQNIEVVNLVKELGGKAYLKKSFMGLFYGLISKYKFVNCWSSDIGFMHTSNGVLVNFWHGIPLKQIEYDIEAGTQSKAYQNFFTKLNYRMPLLRKNDIIYNSSFNFEKIFQSSLEPKRIYNLGSPRLDILKYSKKDILSFLQKYSATKEINLLNIFHQYEKVFIYMPTFRDTGKVWLQDAQTSFFELNNFLIQNNFLLVMKLHPNDRFLEASTGELSHIIHTNISDIYPILPFTDCLISDYSSIIFDYLILGKRIVLFPFDKEDYINSSRGLYFEYDELFSEFEEAFDIKSLISLLGKSDNLKNKYPKIEKLLGEIHMKKLCSEKIYKHIRNKEQ